MNLPEDSIFSIWQSTISIVNKVHKRALRSLQQRHAFDSTDNGRIILWSANMKLSSDEILMTIYVLCARSLPPRFNVAVARRVHTGVCTNAWLCNFWLFACSPYEILFHIVS